MSKTKKRILKIIAGILVFFLIVIGGLTLVLNSSSFQQKIIQSATTALTEKIGTRVSIESVSVNLFSQRVGIYGLEVEDQQHRKLLHTEEGQAEANLLDLFHRKLTIGSVKIIGADILLEQKPGENANFQFLIDAFKSKKPKKKKKDADKKTAFKFQFDPQKILLERINISYNDMPLTLSKLEYRKEWGNKFSAELYGLSGKWKSMSKKGPVDHSAGLERAHVTFTDSLPIANLTGLYYRNNNHKPRRNTGKPKRGFFDAKHMDMTANLQLIVNHADKDSVNITISQGNATDSVAGFYFTDLRLRAGVNKTRACLSDVIIKMKHTELRFDSGTVVLPSKKEGRALSYQTSTISGETQLQDIARPFAPVLKNFTQPLKLKVRLDGTADELYFHAIRVSTPNSHLTIKATGSIQHLKEKEKLTIGFNVNPMMARNSVIPKIINQFPVKKLMMDELHALGDIRYVGRISIFWKCEAFKGTLTTQAGNVDFSFALDEREKYINGELSTRGFDIGKAISKKGLGPVDCSAKFKVDFSKKRTAQMRRVKGGKLPIGTADILIGSIHYGPLHMTDVGTTIESDGATAKGQISRPGHFNYLYCDFSYTNTDSVRKTTFKPHLNFSKNIKKKEVNDSTKKKGSWLKRLLSKKKKK
ncbi:MAG: AsmA family protein [Prevotella sp.]|nr:AsmA family protein [Prevotella sp.]